MEYIKYAWFDGCSLVTASFGIAWSTYFPPFISQLPLYSNSYRLKWNEPNRWKLHEGETMTVYTYYNIQITLTSKLETTKGYQTTWIYISSGKSSIKIHQNHVTSHCIPSTRMQYKMDEARMKESERKKNRMNKSYDRKKSSIL